MAVRVINSSATASYFHPIIKFYMQAVCVEAAVSGTVSVNIYS